MVNQKPPPVARHAADHLDLLDDRPVLRDLYVQQPLHHLLDLLSLALSTGARFAFSKVDSAVQAPERD